METTVSDSQCCPSFQGKKKVQVARKVKEVGFLDALTSNSLHTESWLHLSHAIQPLNDGSVKEKRKKKEKKERNQVKKKSTHASHSLSHRQMLPLAENEPRAPVLQLLSIT